jgi:hypothetical protein
MGRVKTGIAPFPRLASVDYHSRNRRGQRWRFALPLLLIAKGFGRSGVGRLPNAPLDAHMKGHDGDMMDSVKSTVSDTAQQETLTYP